MDGKDVFKILFHFLWIGLSYITDAQMTCDPQAYLQTVPDKGTDPGAICIFPFNYQNTKFYYCTNINYETGYWCATSTNYENDQKWGVCPAMLPGTMAPVTTTAGATCHFPFVYKARLFYSCTTFDSRTGSPWCSTTPQYSESTSGTCRGVLPCFDTFTRFNNSHLIGGSRLLEGKTTEQCRHLCLCDVTCTAYEWQRNKNECWYHKTTDIDTNKLRRNGNIDFFRRDICSRVTPTVKTHDCIDTFRHVNNAFAYGGISEPGANDVDTCRRSCLAAPSCVAFDLDRNPNVDLCYLHYNRENLDQVMQGVSGVSHYLRERCVSVTTVNPAVECLDNFVKYSDTHGFGGTGISGASMGDLCKQECLSRTNCTGFDFSMDTSPRCFIFFERVDKYHANSVDHYERQPCIKVASTVSRCQDAYNKLENRHGYGGDLQWTVIDMNTCKLVCNSKPDCMAFDFDRSKRECFHFEQGDYILNPNEASGVDHYVRQFTCASTVSTRRVTIQPGVCVDTFEKATNTLAYGATAAEGITQERECQDHCLSNKLCVAFDFDTVFRVCYIHTNIADLLDINIDAQGITHYRRVKCDAVSNCEETYTVTRRRNSAGGIEQPPNYDSPPVCRFLCVQVSVQDTKCYGFDFDKTLKLCFLHMQRYVLGEEVVTNVDNYRRDFSCVGGSQRTTVRRQPVGCVDTFTPLNNTNGWEGTLESDFGTDVDCRWKCLESNRGDARVCHAYDFNTLDLTCWIFYTDIIEYNPQSVPGIIHYRRDFRCAGTGPTPIATTPCRDTFTKVSNRNSYDGKFIVGIDSENQCREYCLIKSDFTDDYCWGFDFDRNDNSCWAIHSNYSLSPDAANGVDNYRRGSGCTFGTGPSVCRDEFSVTKNRNAPGGEQQAGSLNLRQCEDLCLAATSPRCRGFDFNQEHRQCFLFLRSYEIGATEIVGVDNYRRIPTCGGAAVTTESFGCKDPFIKVEDRNADDGAWRYGIFTAEECADLCRETTPYTTAQWCRGYDHVQESQECWLQLKDYRVNPDGFPGTNNYRRQIVCSQPTISTGSRCEDTFAKTPSRNAFDGMVQLGSYAAHQCAALCRLTDPSLPNANGEFCWGYDHGGDNQECWLHFREYQLSSSPAPKIDNYRRNFDCVTLPPTEATVATIATEAPGCRDPFTKASNRLALNGVLQQGSSSYTVQQCMDVCLLTAPDQGANHCRGFDHVRATGQCWLHFFDYNLRGEPAPGVDNYRRRYECTPIGSTPSRGTGATAFPSTVTSSTAPTVTRSTTPTVKPSTTPTITPSTTRKETVSESSTMTPAPVTPAPPDGCTDPFVPYIMSSGQDAFKQAGTHTQASCGNVCRQTSPDTGGAFCYGFDFYDRSQECWLHFDDYLPMRNRTFIVTSYKRIFFCVPIPRTTTVCVDAFSPLTDRNANGGEETQIKNVALCKQTCLDTNVGDDPLCYGFDFDKDFGSCWLFLKPYVLNDGLAEGITNYRRIFTCT